VKEKTKQTSQTSWTSTVTLDDSKAYEVVHGSSGRNQQGDRQILAEMVSSWSKRGDRTTAFVLGWPCGDVGLLGGLDGADQVLLHGFISPYFKILIPLDLSLVYICWDNVDHLRWGWLGRLPSIDKHLHAIEHALQRIYVLILGLEEVLADYSRVI